VSLVRPDIITTFLTRTLKPDISTWQKTGYFYLALTQPIPSLDIKKKS